MGRHTLEYPKEGRNTVVRKGKERGHYDLGAVHTIINNSMVAHVSFSPAPSDPFPAILPMIAVMGSYERPSADLDEPLDCYLHGYVSSRIMNLSRATAAAPDSSTTSTAPGLPVCIAASKVDGLVLALTPNSHSYNYRSAILFGHATPVTSADEKLYAMELVTNKVMPGRWDNTRTPPNAAEMSSTNILRVTIQSGSAKVRDGPPADSREDLADEEVLDRVWTGVVPLVERFEAPVKSAYCRLPEVPAHVGEWVESFNQREEEYVKEVSERVKGQKVVYGDV